MELRQEARTIYGDCGRGFHRGAGSYGLMLESANEMALAIGEEVSGSVKKFVELMNTRASSWDVPIHIFNNPKRTSRMRPM